MSNTFPLSILIEWDYGNTSVNYCTSHFTVFIEFNGMRVYASPNQNIMLKERQVFFSALYRDTKCGKLFTYAWETEFKELCQHLMQWCDFAGSVTCLTKRQSNHIMRIAHVRIHLNTLKMLLSKYLINK